MGSWYWVKGKVKCPMYLSHSYPRKGFNPCINCDTAGIMGRGCEFQLKFKNQKERDEFMQKYCENSYFKCKMFNHIEKMLKEEEK